MVACKVIDTGSRTSGHITKRGRVMCRGLDGWLVGWSVDISKTPQSLGVRAGLVPELAYDILHLRPGKVSLRAVFRRSRHGYVHIYSKKLLANRHRSTTFVLRCHSLHFVISSPPAPASPLPSPPPLSQPRNPSSRRRRPPPNSPLRPDYPRRKSQTRPPHTQKRPCST